MPDYRKIVFLMFLIKNDVDLLNECGSSKIVIIRLNEEFWNFLLQQNEENLHYTEDREESILKSFK